MLVRLDYSGHESPRIVDVSDEEFETLKRLDKGAYIFDCQEGRDLIGLLDRKPTVADKIPTFCVYC